MAKTERRYGRRLEVFAPRHDTVQDFVAGHGINGFYDAVEARKACCHVRKIEPLQRALAGKQAWITGLRAAQSPTRDKLKTVAFDHANNLVKISPLADWSEREVWVYLRANNVLPQHRLRSLHPRGGRRRRSALRPLVVGTGIDQGMRAARGRRWPTAPRPRTPDFRGNRFMNARAHADALRVREASHGASARLDWLESEAIHILREAAAECRMPALLFSGGKDSLVLLRLAEKAFRPGGFPFPLLHVDTGHNFPK
jgi:3'-phosphoadenosine 5'-phosphosulfate sulfotransferase (PAPS reductase)/FAD synthetase